MRMLKVLLVLPLFTVVLCAQSIGPDVTVSALTDVGGFGQNAGHTISAFAVGTTACNVGNAPVLWTSNNNQHPVIAQNMYQYIGVTGTSYSRFQQIGMSWLKHGFASTNSPGCGSCVQPPQGGGALGVGCTDSYGSGLNGGQSYLGPRSEVNASTGAYPYPHSSPTGDATIAGRLQVANGDLGNASAQYFVEAQYVTADDALANNKNNNATWQKINTPGIGAGSATFNGSAHPQQPAIYAWQSIDAGVSITTVDMTNDGRFLIGKKVTSLGGGNYHYEFAIHNLNSDRSGGTFTVVFAAGAVVSNAGFRSIPYHSGEPYANTAWTPTITPNQIVWACTPWITDLNANALRWGTMDNFWCDATAAADVSETIGLFKPPSPCVTQFTSPLGSGSVQIDQTTCPSGVNKTYFIAASTVQGAYPNGWFYGVDLPLPSLISEYTSGYPFTGPLDAAGATTIGPMTGLPPGLHVYSVTVHLSATGAVLANRPKVSYIIP
jgi:hypothetical protein